MAMILRATRCPGHVLTGPDLGAVAGVRAVPLLQHLRGLPSHGQHELQSHRMSPGHPARPGPAGAVCGVVAYEPKGNDGTIGRQVELTLSEPEVINTALFEPFKGEISMSFLRGAGFLSIFRKYLPLLFVSYGLIHCGVACAKSESVDDPKIMLAKAQRLLDTYYGSSENLTQAAELLARVAQVDNRIAAAYVQSARLVIMGGHLVSDEYVGGTVEKYHALLDKALELDPTNQKAHILKAEAYDIQGLYDLEKRSLDAAAKYGNDPWLWMGYGRHAEKMGNRASAYMRYASVEAAGPGTEPSQRKAYVQALLELSSFRIEGMPGIEERAATALRERYPTDAWILGGFADKFIFRGRFDDAIFYARAALKTMNYGAARLSLAVALYGKAASLIAAGRPKNESAPLIAEAQALGFERSAVLRRLGQSGPAIAKLMPTIDRIVR
jgi:tetratricopeptide (TPR) repeat protein